MLVTKCAHAGYANESFGCGHAENLYLALQIADNLIVGPIKIALRLLCRLSHFIIVVDKEKRTNLNCLILNTKRKKIGPSNLISGF